MFMQIRRKPVRLEYDTQKSESDKFWRGGGKQDPRPFSPKCLHSWLGEGLLPNLLCDTATLSDSGRWLEA
jgi:hypothetical protein